MKKNLPSPTRRSDVDIRVNKLQANPVSGHIERGARPLPATETELRSRPRQSGAPYAMRRHNEGHARVAGRRKKRRSDKKTRKTRSM